MGSQPATTVAAPFTANINFDEDVTGFDASDVNATNGTVDSITGGPQNYLATITPSGTSDVTISVPANVAQDGTGNPNTASNSVSVPYAAVTTKGPGDVDNGIALWLRADIGTSSTTDGATVTTWADQSGNSNDGTEVTNPPAFANSASEDVNFNPAIRFDGTDDFLTLTDLSAIKGGSDYAMFAVGIREDNGSNYVLGVVNGGGGIALHYGYRGNNTATLAQWSNDINMTVAEFDPPSPYLLFGELDGSSGHLLREVRNQSVTEDSNTNTVGLTGSNTEMVGRHQTNSYNGRINEVIVYSQALTPTEEQKIMSYLSLKYGMTLLDSSNNVQSYLDSASQTLWGAAANSAYNHDIAGIGHDSGSDFHQKQSKSINSDALVTMGAGNQIAATNSANSASMTDGTFLLWGNNDGDVSTWSETNAPSGYQRLARQWQVVETGSVASVKIAVNESDLPAFTGDLYFLVDAGNNLSGVTPMAMTPNGNTWEIDYDFTGTFFGFATQLPDTTTSIGHHQWAASQP